MTKTQWRIVALLIFVIVVTGLVLYFRQRYKIQSGKGMNQGVQQSTEDFITELEGEELTVYKDSVGIDTVGIGHKVLPQDGLNYGDEISQEQSDAFFKKDSTSAANDILKHITQPITQNQFDALFALVYNIGKYGFDTSTVLKDLNKYNLKNLTDAQLDEIKTAWLAWRFAGTQPVLLGRRQKEFDLFSA